MKIRTTPAWFAIFVGLVLVLGCGKKDKDDHKDDDHKDEDKNGHADAGPHGGALFATADHKYHLELKADDGKPAILYVLDDKAKKELPVDATGFSMKVAGQAEKVEFKPDGGKPGAVARFKSDAPLPAKVDMKKVEFTGTLNGKQYIFEPEDH